MGYQGILLGSWKILWRNPYLWLFGALALFGSGAGSWVTNFPPGPADFSGGAGVTSQDSKDLAAAVAWLANHLFIVIAIVSGIAMLTTALWFVSVYYGAAMIWSAGKLADDESPSRREAAHAARGNYWSYAGLSVILDCAVLVGVGLAVIPLVLAVSQASTAVEFHSGDLPSQIGEFAAFMLIGSAKDPLVIAGGYFFGAVSYMVFVTMGLLRELSGRALLLDGKGVFASLATALRLLLRNPVRIALTWLIGLGVTVAFTAVAVVGVLAVVAPLLLSMFLAAVVLPGNAMMLLILIPFGLLIVAVVFLLGGMISAFFAAYWGYAYRRLSSYLVSLESVNTTLEEPAT